MSRANTDKATVDFETRSACSLKKSGAWKYSLDPTTEVLCLVYRLPHWDVGRTALWHPAFKSLGIPEGLEEDSLLELLDWVEAGLPLEAHNAFFERAIWENILHPRHGFPAVPVNSWRCSAAKAASHALPRHLGDAGKALNLAIQKDEEGKKVMMKISKPRKPRKKEREAWVAAGKTLAEMPPLWWESLDLFETLWRYCASDVLSEEALSHALDDLSSLETTYYCMDQRINQRGFQLDPEAVECALSLIASEVALLNAELLQLTSGAVSKATQRDKMKTWLRKQGVNLYDTKGATIDELLKEDDEFNDTSHESVSDFMEALPPTARRALEIMRTLGRSSTAKYETMQQWACGDGRVRGGLLYHGATTGRWSGAGVQPHNFPKGTIKGFDMGEAWELIKTLDRQILMSHVWNPKAPKPTTVMEILACALRGAIVAKRGHQLYVADYASIEARVLLWLAREESALKLFREGGDLYLDMAESIYGYTCTKDENPKERGIGKIAILGLGYQMGWAKFLATCAAAGVVVEDEFAMQVVEAYRSKYARVKQLWWDTEDAACEAVRRKGHVIKQDRISWQRLGNFLFCTLPSGRRLAYPFPELRERETPWGAVKMALTFKGVNPYNKQWQRQTTYGGSLVENIVQAISRDIMAHALLQCEAGGIYTPVLSVHDEVVAEAKIGQGDVHEFEQLLTACPKWAQGCPIGAEGWKGMRYRK